MFGDGLYEDGMPRIRAVRIDVLTKAATRNDRSRSKHFHNCWLEEWELYGMIPPDVGIVRM